MKEKVGEVTFNIHKMSWLERKVRRWWMQRQLWNSYKKAITIAWAEYEAALVAEDEELSDRLFEQCIAFRVVYERAREATDAIFERTPKIAVLDDTGVSENG